MNLYDATLYAAGALAKHRRRTALTLLGVAIGVASVLLLTSLGEGARGYVHAQFQIIGSNVLGIVPGKTETTGAVPGIGGAPNDLSIRDAEALARALPGAQNVVPMAMGTDSMEHAGRSRRVLVLGATPGIQETHNVGVRTGRFLPEAPWDQGASVVVLGANLVRELFPGESPLGKIVRLGGFRLRVVGTAEPRGLHFGIDMDEAVFVPVATCMRMFDRTSLARIVLQVRSAAELEASERVALALLVERHGEEDFTLVTPDAVLGSLTSILGVLTLALVGIAAISLTVAGIGIMNVMLVSVSERTKEIGLLKAIGAAPRDVLSVFLIEAVLISTCGGVLGLASGGALVRAAANLYPDFPAAAPLWAVLSAALVSLAVGVVFGVLPARRALRLDPVAALAGA